MINIAAFTAEVRNRRDEALALVGTNPLIATYRDALRLVCDETEWGVEAPAAAAKVNPVDELRNSLSVAAGNAMQYGATEAQINFIAALAVKNNDFNIIGCSGRLTKREASLIIDSMKKAG